MMYQRRILKPDGAAAGRSSWLSPGIVGRRRMDKHAVSSLAAIAPTDADILITGPSTLDKEQYAEFVHRNSQRAKAAFVSLNCAAVPRQWLASELFRDIEEGNGAASRVQGPIAAAEDGTLFLDEIHALSPLCQVKLLRFIQEKEYRRIGETHLRRADLRLIAASSADLPGAVRAGRFREDLLLQLRIFPITPLQLWRRIVRFVRHLYLALAQHAFGLPRPTAQKLSRTAEPEA